MQNRPSLLSVFDPRLNFPMMAIIVFLLFMAARGVIDAVVCLTAGQPLLAVHNLLSAFLYAVPAWGLMKVKRWARLFEIIWSVLMVLLGIFIMLQASLLAGIFIIVTHGIIGVYLLSDRCRRIFETGPADE